MVGYQTWHCRPNALADGPSGLSEILAFHLYDSSMCKRKWCHCIGSTALDGWRISAAPLRGCISVSGPLICNPSIQCG